MKKFITLFAEQFDETDEALITEKTTFKDLDEWDSMIALSVIAMIDEEYEKTINGDDIKNSSTIEELFLAVEQK